MNRFLFAILASVTTVSAPPARAAECPAPTVPFLAEYDLHRNGKAIGTATISLKRRGDGTFDYRLESEAKGGLIGFIGARAHEYSHWTLHGQRPRPLEYERGQKIAFRERHYEARFDWNDHEARGKARGEPWHSEDLPEDTLDQFLVNLALLADLRCGRETLGYTVLEKGELEEWRFERRGEKSVSVPGGTFDTIRVAKRHHSADRVSLAWHAPALNWLAVRIDHQDDADEDRFSLRLRRYVPRTE